MTALHHDRNPPPRPLGIRKRVEAPPPARTEPPARNPAAVRSTADLARYVGLARTTVSRVLNGHPGIKKKTVERVRRALEETGFTPNAFATRLRGKGAAIVGICMENLLTPPAVAKLAALQKRLRQRGFTSMIEVLEPGESRSVVQHFRAMQVNAVVFIGHFSTGELAERIAEMRRQGIPHLLIDQSGVPDSNFVAVDRMAAMHLVMNHLLDHGHRSFALLGMNRPFESIRERLRGIADALKARGLDPATATRSLDYLEQRENDLTFGRNLAHSFARTGDCPTAFVAVNDDVAVGALLGLSEAGMRVPDDVSVVGFNNQDHCLITSPTISSIDQQIEATVEAAESALAKQLADPAQGLIQHRIQPAFIARGSSGRVRSS